MTYRSQVLLIALFIGLVFVFIIWSYRPTVDSVMADFHAAEGRAEDMLMDPLILNADLVKYRVIEEVRNPKMDKRRYAIGFLGNERIAEAMPVLLQILHDKSEKEYFRGDALESIFRIDKSEGRRLAAHYSAEGGYLGELAREILDGSYMPFQRTHEEARVGHHE